MPEGLYKDYLDSEIDYWQSEFCEAALQLVRTGEATVGEIAYYLRENDQRPLAGYFEGYATTQFDEEN